MDKRNLPHYPPNHPNWTGRTYRTSQEAFGYQWWGDEVTPKHKRRPGVIVLTLVALLLLLGVAI